ncbi:Aste57867_14123 [Aphanomyces stellatus]|uniref:Aste57867_14123 protein n=1 Tax=Aphanomyces stellatus TaxID=120398 RepID=A0A485L1I7_9STRA|nr:hypothetical protein As57867_014072 [Aphanomyces stellatus]VFT90950.1 Aste57867_14123 [Aphanomyces stellatus]
MASEEAFAWELAKENVVPLSRGRNVEKLNVALAQSHSSKRETMLQQTEKELNDKISAYKGDDPIKNWLEYYKWVQENFPSDTTKMILVLERATQALESTRRYRNDIRYMKLWVTYADKAEKPFEIFQFLHKSKIGDKLALFYIAWAFLSEKRGKIKDAETIYNRGFLKKAEPLDVLQKKYDEFNRRASQKWLHSAEDADHSDPYQAPYWSANHFGTVNNESAQGNDAIPLGNLTNSIRQENLGASLTIYTEQNPSNTSRDEYRGKSDYGRPMQFSVEPETANTTNSRNSSWPRREATTGRSAPQHNGVSSVPIYVDGINEERRSKKRTFSSVEHDATLSQHKPKSCEVFRFCQNNVCNTTGTELCFEEARAQKFLSLNRIKTKQNAFLVNPSDEVTPCRSNTASFNELQAACNEDITINTKLALDDINDMFQSPQEQPKSALPVWVPKTEEPIVRKLLFSSNCEADDRVPDNQFNENFTEQVEEQKESPLKKNLGGNQSTAPSHKEAGPSKSRRVTYKDILGFSFSGR